VFPQGGLDVNRGDTGQGDRAALGEDPAQVSVIIPTLNEASEISPTLRSLRSQHPRLAEIIVVDGGSNDDTTRIVEVEGARVVRSRSGRGRQLHTGANAATGEALLFLHADTRLPAGALQAVGRALADHRVVGGRFRLRYPHRHPVLGIIAFFSRFPWTWTSYGDSGFFVRRSVYGEMGGFEDIPLLEDSRFFGRLRKAGRVRVLPLTVVTSCRRFCRRGPLRQLLSNILLVLRYWAGGSPARTDDRYEAKSESCSTPVVRSNVGGREGDPRPPNSDVPELIGQPVAEQELASTTAVPDV
jgi:rSAM/selenodomain-associated transferase 2